jgi:hypothetical protein
MAGAKTLDRAETWLARIPGIGTYRERERRRETDKQFREHLASLLQQARDSIKRVSRDLSKSGRLGCLGDLDHLSSSIQQMADTIRYASYGFGGIFDLKRKIREEELDHLYAFDISLLDEIEGIQSKIAELKADSEEEVLVMEIREAQGLVNELEDKFRKRGDFLS